MPIVNGDIPRFLANGDRPGRRRAFRGLTRSAPSSRARFENCRTAIFGGRSSEATGLHVCKNGCAEMHRGGPYCFLLAALHSVAERVNPRKARPPAPHGPRVLTSSRSPLTAAGKRVASFKGLG